MNIALVIAGGTGQRMGQDIPKQFLSVANKPILIYTLEKFQRCESINSIYVVSLQGWETIVSAYCKQFSISKLSGIFTGGHNRYQSIMNGLLGMESSVNATDIIILHDANRPIIDDEIICDGINKANTFDCAISSTECVDSMFISDGVYVTGNIDRKDIIMGRTPECIKFKKIIDIYTKIRGTNLENICLSGILIALGEKVIMSKGSSNNIKLTTLEDIDIFRALLSSEKYEWLK